LTVCIVFFIHSSKKRSDTNGAYLTKFFYTNAIFVIPAQAGVQENGHNQQFWIPACAGMTESIRPFRKHCTKGQYTPMVPASILDLRRVWANTTPSGNKPATHC